jgi:nucleotide-binding universal stress UspA family protein
MKSMGRIIIIRESYLRTGSASTGSKHGRTYPEVEAGLSARAPSRAHSCPSARNDAHAQKGFNQWMNRSVTMSLKSILAVASASSDDFSLLQASAKIAARWGAFLQVVPAFPDPAADYVAYGVSLRGSANQAIVDRVSDGERATQERIEALAQDAAQALRDEGKHAVFSVARRALTPSAEVARAAVLNDLVLFGGDAARGVLKGLFAEALLAMRAPCLIVNRPIGFGPAAIAWDGSAEAGRAVQAALPLLEAASEVVIIRNTHDPRFDANEAGAERLSEYLARHGVCNVNAFDTTDERVAASVLSVARTRRCDLVVAGAYGRPRLYEMLLGGATREFVSAEGAPNLLLAH